VTAPRHMPIIEAWPKGLVDVVAPLPFSLDLLQMTYYHLAFEGVIERNIEGKTKNAYDLFSEISGVNVDFNDPKYAIEMCTDDKIINEIKPKLPENFIVIQMRATSPIRMMDVEKWFNIISELHDKTNLSFVFADAEKYSKYYDKIITDYTNSGLDKNRFYNACSISKSINYAVNIIGLSKGLIGIDSAMSHICEGLKKPGLCIYGPFKADLRIRYYKYIDYIEPDPSMITCKKWPCMYHGKEILWCPYRRDNHLDPQCMSVIDNNKIIEKSLNLFKDYTNVTDKT
jgi:ADP-heptose:LPS heptosyltransferase